MTPSASRENDIEDLYPLSPMQEGMLFHSLYAPESGVYFEQLSCTLRDLDVDAFQKAWERVVDRHSALRTSFIFKKVKEPAQVVHRRLPIRIRVDDWGGMAETEQEEALRKFLQKDRERGFDLSVPPLMRWNLIKGGKDKHHFIWSYHHALLDGWSVPLILRDLMLFYETFRQGRDIRLPASRPFRDYIRWLKRQDLQKAKRFWEGYLKGLTAPTSLPGQLTPREEAVGWQNVEQERWLDSAATETLQSFARQHRLTVSTLVQAAWALLLSRYSGEDDVVFGVTVSGRPPDLEGAESMVGLFINTLPARARTSPQMTALSFLREIQSSSVEMRQYEYSPLVEIQSWSGMPRGIPLFESIVVYENFPVAQSAKRLQAPLQIQDLLSFEQTNYPLTVVSGLADGLMLKIVYDGNRFEQSAISRMLECLEMLLGSLVYDPQKALTSLPLLPEKESRQLLINWNQTAAAYPRNRCVHELFESQVRERPEAPALFFEGEALTYQRLNKRANQLARHLKKMGVGPEALVGICAERSFEMIVGILGVLKAGGAYLPLDPAYPPGRLSFMAEDSGMKVLLTQRRLLDRLPDAMLHACPRLLLDGEWEGVSGEPDEDLQGGATPDNLAYVIYTSGSTGRPKGTMLSHKGLSNLTVAQRETFGIGEGSRILQFSPFSFDASVWEIFMALANGGALCLARQEVLASGMELAKLMQKEGVTNVTLPPSMARVLPSESLSTLRTVIAAGEKCPSELVERWAGGRQFFNAYGPTETTVCASIMRCERGREGLPPIGRPIANGRLYVLNGDFQPLPIGASGELYVGGVSVARGYLKRPDLTAEKFVPDPFGDEPGGRLYRTGDLVRYLPDGNLEFMGRIDHQVKVRGFRIEPGEVEAAIATHPAVKEAAVSPWGETPEGRLLVAYVTLNHPPEPSPEQWRRFLKPKLPEYMIPSAFIALQAMPLTPSGKIDRPALPDPKACFLKSKRTMVPPRSPLEKGLAEIWEQVLNASTVGIEDNFFDLGGNSLIAIRLLAQIQKKLGKEISLLTLFQNPTIERLASITDRGEPRLPSSLVPLQKENSGHEPFLFFVHPSGGRVHWYVDLANELSPSLSFYALQAKGLDGDGPPHETIEDMAKHYVEALTRFHKEGPVYLGSWSMGVVIAFEMAQQLREKGREVNFLAMLDQGPRLPSEEPEDDAAYLFGVFRKNVPLSLARLRDLSPDDQLLYILEEGKRVKFIYPEATLSQIRQFVYAIRLHTTAWRKYVPRAYPGRITLFRAEHQPEEGSREEDLGWSELAAGGVDVHVVPGNHLTILQHPHVRILAKTLFDSLSRHMPSTEARRQHGKTGQTR